MLGLSRSGWKRKGPDENLRLQQSDRTIGPLSRGAASNDQKRQIGYRHACVVGKLSVEEIFEVAGRLFMPDSYLSNAIPTLPGHNTFSIGIGETFDVRPAVPLVAG
jgi:hypothetical protein